MRAVQDRQTDNLGTMLRQHVYTITQGARHWGLCPRPPGTGGEGREGTERVGRAKGEGEERERRGREGEMKFASLPLGDRRPWSSLSVIYLRIVVTVNDFVRNQYQQAVPVRVATRYAPARSTPDAAARTLRPSCSPSLTPAAPSAPYCQ